MRAIAVAMLLLAGTASHKVLARHYCMATDLTEYPGDRPLGTFRLDVVITGRAPKLSLTFENSMPDSGQVVMFGPVRLHAIGNGRYTFDFVDNWEAPGRGTIAIRPPRASISIERTGPASDSWGQNAGRNFGDFVLRPAPCRSKG